MESKRYRQMDGVVTRVIAGEKLIVPIRGHIADMQNIFSVDEVGSFIWDHLDGKRTGADILRLILDEFDVEEAEAKQDLNEFLDKMVNAGLIVEG